ncbi:unnamed protein product [Prunus armeniaca]|uniref:Uncharacterized protein n=1 Tax=Prunus armeniaca TaxID=36596 RepID=A0A6J5V869_PRUAR|nr:unnamed protein product [Prunus armeniaca]
MEEVQTSFDKILTLTAEKANPLVIEEEDDVVAQDILERSLVAKIYSPKPVHKKSFKHRMLEIWDPVGEVNIKDLPEEPDGTVAPSKMNLKFSDFWVQIRNVPLLKMTEKLARSIGDRTGTWIDISRCEGVRDWSCFTDRQSSWQRAKGCADQNRVQIGEKMSGELVMEGEASKHKKVDEGKNNEITLYESVVCPEMMAHHEK